MSASKHLFAVAAGALVVAMAASAPALAQRGGGGGSGGRSGDTFVDDAQKNPRFIEPGAFNDPARYRVGAPYERYGDRRRAARGYYTEGSGYEPSPRRGRVYVQPY